MSVVKNYQSALLHGGVLWRQLN